MTQKNYNLRSGHWHINIKDKTISFSEACFSLFDLNQSFQEETSYRLNDDKIKMKFSNLNEIYRLKEVPEYKDSVGLVVYMRGKIVIFPTFIHTQGDIIHGTSLNITGYDVTNFMLNEGIISNEVSIWWAEREYDKFYFYYTKASYDMFSLNHPFDFRREMFTEEFQEQLSYIGKNLPDKLHLLQDFEVQFKRLVEKKTTLLHNIYPIHKQDSIRWLETRCAVQQQGPEGQVLVVAGLTIDITERIESEERLKQLQAESLKLVKANNIAIDLAQLLVWSLDFSDTKEPDILSNEIYRKCLGLDADDKGYVKFEDFIKTTYPDEEGKQSMEHLLAEYKRTQNGEIDEYLGVVVKHQNLKTGEAVYLEHHTRVEERFENNELKIIGGYVLNITTQRTQQEKFDALNKENLRLVRAQQLALNSGRVMIWYYDDAEFDDPMYFYANDLFFDKLGLNKYKESHFDINEYNDTIVKDEEGKNFYKEFLHQQKLILESKKNSYFRLVLKHKNLKTGEILYMEHNLEVQKRYDDGRIMVRGGFLSDITEKRNYEKEIEYLVRHDSISKLRNRYGFETYIESLDMPRSYSLVVADIDGLKFVNDAFGHLVGDELIRKIAVILNDNFGHDSTIFRIGGDEFAIISKEIFDEEINIRINNIKKQINAYNKMTGIECGLSIGYETSINQSIHFRDAFISAENMMYRRKLNERNSRKSKTMETVLETLNVKTEETKEHCDRLVEYAVSTLKEMGYTRGSDLADMSLLCQVHDIGKITISEDILSKPGKLTDEEYQKIKSHSEAGYKIVKNIVDSERIADGVLYHHERVNGTGYPFGLVGDEIPVFAKVLSVVDAYDVMVSGRVYSKPKTKEEAIKELKECIGSQFDETVVKAFIQYLTK